MECFHSNDLLLLFLLIPGLKRTRENQVILSRHDQVALDIWPRVLKVEGSNFVAPLVNISV